MLTYILVSLVVLIVILSVVVFYSYRQINQLTVGVQRNIADISSVRHLLDRCGSSRGPLMHPDNHANFPFSNSRNFDDDDDNDNNNNDDNDDDLDDLDDLDDDDDDDDDDDNDDDLDKNDDDDEIDDVLKELDEIDDESDHHGHDDDHHSHDDDQTGPGDQEKVLDITINSGKKKNTPDQPAKDYDVGFVIVSSNDNSNYEVIATKTGLKRWKKVKA